MIPFSLPPFPLASYSKPNVTQSCKGVRCWVTCASYGGYPGTEVAWKIHGSANTNSQLLKVENNTQVPSPSTMLVNSTSTVFFNCSNREMGNLSCSVGNVTSNWFSVCEYWQDEPWWFLHQSLFYTFCHRLLDDVSPSSSAELRPFGREVKIASRNTNSTLRNTN